MFNVRFAASRRFKEKIERLAEVLGVHGAASNLAMLLETAVDLAIDKKDPKKKQQRRQKREAKKKPEKQNPPPRPDEVSRSATSSAVK